MGDFWIDILMGMGYFEKKAKKNGSGNVNNQDNFSFSTKDIASSDELSNDSTNVDIHVKDTVDQMKRKEHWIWQNLRTSRLS